MKFDGMKMKNFKIVPIALAAACSIDEETFPDASVITLLLSFWRLVCLNTQCGLQHPDGFDSQ